MVLSEVVKNVVARRDVLNGKSRIDPLCIWFLYESYVNIEINKYLGEV